ncbi:MAG: PadR family transcriptional regulator [Methanobacteriota archaeon]|nr:MAG: PadR family transcriptional regulator [Euryarchaeota archaeon]
MSIAKMVVLGALESLGRGSGYDVMQELSRKKIDRWTDVKKGSIYHALRQLRKEGAIREVEQTKIGRYPEKTIFQITAKGRRLFDSLQEQAFLGLFPHFYGFKIALKFNTRRTPEEIKEFANRAIILIDLQFKAMDDYLKSLDKSSMLYKTDSFFIKHEKMLFGAEKEWIRDVVRNLSVFRGA